MPLAIPLMAAPRRLRAGVGLALAGLVGVLALPATAHTQGNPCVTTPADTCERWSATVDDPQVTAPARSDQFPVATLVGSRAVFVVSKDVALNTADPYASRGKALVVAYDKSTGAELWRATRDDNYYINPNAAALSPDGRTLIITGGSYDAYLLAAKQSKVMTTAFDAITGGKRWSQVWGARPDGRDNGTTIAVSPDGREVYVGAVSTPVSSGLDMAIIGYGVTDGRQLFSSIYSGPKSGGVDSPFAMGVSRTADMVYLAGWSDSPAAEYDADYATVAFALGHRSAPPPQGSDDGDGPGKSCKNVDRGRGVGKHCDSGSGGAAPPAPAAGQLMWAARYDGVGAHKSDRANILAVDPSGQRVYVSGDSFAGGTGSSYSYGTVAYDALTGQRVWQARFDGGRGGFNSATRMVATARAVLVSGQATAPSSTDGNDATTVAYDPATGRQLWTSSVAPARSDDYARGLAASPDGQTAYLLTTDTPIINYTALSQLTLTAYDVVTGAVRWTSTLDGGLMNSLSGDALGVSPAGETVVVGGTLKRSANPLGGESQNIYDGVVAAFAG